MRGGRANRHAGHGVCAPRWGARAGVGGNGDQGAKGKSFKQNVALAPCLQSGEWVCGGGSRGGMRWENWGPSLLPRGPHTPMFPHLRVEKVVGPSVGHFPPVHFGLEGPSIEIDSRGRTPTVCNGGTKKWEEWAIMVKMELALHNGYSNLAQLHKAEHP